MYNSQMPINRIADRINVARSTLYRELRRGGVTEPSDLYSADLAQKNTKQRKWF
jgi:IS30 family transposase